MNIDFNNFFVLEKSFITLLFENDFLVLFPELFLVSCTLFLLVYGVFYTTSREKNYPILHTNITWLCVLTLLLTFVIMMNNPVTNGVLFYNTLIVDDFSFFFKLVILFGGVSSIIIARDYIIQESLNAFEYSILILLSICSMFFLVSSADFISMYLAVELQSLSFYILAASKRNSEFSTEAGLKYFLLGAFSSGLLLFGCSIIYGFTGVTNFSELAQIFICGSEVFSAPFSLPACELGMIFLLVGFLFKLTVAPFHMWAPDVYEGAPTSVTAFFAITPKAAILAVFIRIFLESFYYFIFPWQKIIIFCSIASMIVGALAALSQNKIKRLLAFSSIGHVGYILVGFCCGTVEGLQAIFIYLVIYMIMNISLFSLLLAPLRRSGGKEIERLKYITDLRLLAKSNPLVALTITITLFSMAGIPPLAGFYSKAFLFFAAMSSTMYLIAIIGVLSSVISCFYYIRLVKIMYFESPLKIAAFSPLQSETVFFLGVSFFFLLFFILNPTSLYLVTHKVALSLSL